MSLILGNTVTAYQQAVTSKTNDTLANTNLTIPIGANQTMVGSIFAPTTVTGAASGAKYQLVVPAGGVLYQLQFEIINATTPATALIDMITASAAFSNALANINTHVMLANFTIVNGATAGSVTLQFAQLVTDAAAATLDVGAWMRGTKF